MNCLTCYQIPCIYGTGWAPPFTPVTPFTPYEPYVQPTVDWPKLFAAQDLTDASIARIVAAIVAALKPEEKTLREENESLKKTLAELKRKLGDLAK